MNDSAGAWPGVFTRGRLHRVQVHNSRRMRLDNRWLGLADCGAVCLPPSEVSEPPQSRCRHCYPSGSATAQLRLQRSHTACERVERARDNVQETGGIDIGEDAA